MDMGKTAPRPVFEASGCLALIPPAKSYQTCVNEVAFRPRIGLLIPGTTQGLRDSDRPIKLSANTKTIITLEDNKCRRFF